MVSTPAAERATASVRREPGITYKLEAEVTDCSPPRCMTVGRILTMDGQLVAEATAKMAMMDRLASGQALSQSPECPDSVANERSLTRVYAKGGAGGGGGAAGAAGAPDGLAATVAELRRLQQVLVSQLQGEYFCDDLEPPQAAFGWSEDELRGFFESGG